MNKNYQSSNDSIEEGHILHSRYSYKAAYQKEILEDSIIDLTNSINEEMSSNLERLQVCYESLEIPLLLNKFFVPATIKSLICINIYPSFQTSGKELKRKSRKHSCKEFIETPNQDDQDEQKAHEFQRLITLWRTSEKRKEMYKEMENMEVYNIIFHLIF